LLDPHATHDQGTDFLRAFLSQIGIEDVEDLGHARVVAEMVIPNGRLDIFIHVPGILALIIENKIWSKEGDDQVGAYQDWLRENHPECKVTGLVFLSPTGQPPRKPWETPPFKLISYTHIRQWLETFTGLGGTLGSTITMYRDVCSRLNGDTMTNPPNSGSVSELLASNFETAWAITESLEVQTSQMLREYWSTVTAAVNDQLREFPNPIKWEAKIGRYRNKRGADWLSIVPKHCKSIDTEQGWDPVAFTIVVDNIYKEKEKDAYFGIRGICDVKDLSTKFPTIAHRLTTISSPLIEQLHSLEFRTEVQWFLAFQWFRDQTQHAFFELKSKKSMLRLLEEGARNYPTAKWLANILVELFRRSQPVLDELNAAAG
jgi:hypothetical protein